MDKTIESTYIKTFAPDISYLRCEGMINQLFIIFVMIKVIATYILKSRPGILGTEKWGGAYPFIIFYEA